MCAVMIFELQCAFSAISTTYSIKIREQLLQNPEEILELGLAKSKFAIIADQTVAALYASPLSQWLCDNGIINQIITFPAGESFKTRAIKEQMEDQLFFNGFGRDSVIVALGGGVVTDLGGYLAATYCRGIPLIMMPTSLLAMVDAGIGGKVGINVPFGKNMLGSIYQPRLVLIDSSSLKSLPKKEIQNGFVEMIKHGLVADSHYFNFLEDNADELIQLDSQLIQKAIYQSCLIKKGIVERDEREDNRRRILNFGHTIGHALETLTAHSLSHGEAVAIGILVESYIALQSGYLNIEIFKRIHTIFKRYELPLVLPNKISINHLLEAMALDKKSINQTPRFVMLNQMGSVHEFQSNYCTSVDKDTIKKACAWMNDDLCCR